MAAPPSKTLQSLSGEWTLNKDLSDDYSSVLGIQGVNLLLRKAASSTSVHLTVTQPSHDQIRMQQTAISAKIPGTTEDYTLDWTWRTNQDNFFGEVEGRSRWIDAKEGSNQDVAEGPADWIEGDSDGMLIQAEGKKPDGEWEAGHLWGFEVVGGGRRHTRRVKIRNRDGEELRVRMVYDFVEE